MALRNRRQGVFTGRPFLRDAVTGQRGPSAIVEKHVPVSSFESEKRHKHVLVIAFEKDNFTEGPFLDLEQAGDDALGVGTTIDVVSKKDQAVALFNRNLINEASHLVEAAMDVPDNVACHRIYAMRLSRFVQGETNEIDGCSAI